MATKKMSKPAAGEKGKASAGKPAAKKSTVTGTAVKKIAGKKAAVKKVTVKKTAAKKSAPKKTSAKKVAIKKPAAKKAPRKTAAVVKTPAPKPPAKELDRHEVHRRISMAAYHKFAKRDYRHGEHISDWYEAEKEIILVL